MKKTILGLTLLASTGAFAADVVCSEGIAGKAGYKEIKVISELPIEESMDQGVKVDVVVKEVVRLGKKRLTTISTALKGEVIPDIRPLPRPDPATLIRLIGENESGENYYGMLYARESLVSPDSIELNRADGDHLLVNCGK